MGFRDDLKFWYAERGNLGEGKDKVGFEHCKFSMAIKQIETLSKCVTLDVPRQC